MNARDAAGRARSAAAPLPALGRVEAIHLSVRLRRPLLDPTGEYTHRRLWLLRLRDREGVEGLGEGALHPAADDAAASALATLMRRTVELLDSHRAAPGEAIVGLSRELAAEGVPGRAALAALDGALAALRLAGQVRDLAARGEPPPGPRWIPVAASIPFGGPEAGAGAALQAMELGFRTLELRAGYERQTDHLVARLRAIRESVGPEPDLRIDAGGAWDLDTATERIAAAAPFRVEFVEQPMPAWDLTGHAALRERVSVPIALDEAIDSAGGARAALLENAADVLVVKPARVGGGAAALRLVEEASGAGVRVVLGTLFESGVGIAAVLRIAAAIADGGAGESRAHALATAGVLASDLLAAPLVIEDGQMEVPLAVELDEREVARRAIERIEPAR